MAIEGKKGSSSPSPWNCRLPSEAISFNSEYSLPFSHLTMGPEKASDICQSQMVHLESDCVSVYRESGRINREEVDICVCGKMFISAMTTWTCSQLHCRQDQERCCSTGEPYLQWATFKKGDTLWLNCSTLHCQVSQPSNQEVLLGERISRGLFWDCACRSSKLQVQGPVVNKMQFCLLKESGGETKRKHNSILKRVISRGLNYCAVRLCLF